MQRAVGDDLILYFDRHYPWRTSKLPHMRHSAILGIGGNLGNTRQRFEKLFHYLMRHPLVAPVETSPILRNPPFGYLDQPHFYNAVILIKTNLSPYSLLHFCMQTEKIFKRKRAFENSPRTLDIDIIVFDKIAINKRHLTLPHPRFRERESVLIPLSYLKGPVYETLHIHGAHPRRGAQKGTKSVR